jgi:hypothetical protein
VKVGTLLKNFQLLRVIKKISPDPSFPKRGNLKILTLKKGDEGGFLRRPDKFPFMLSTSILAGYAVLCEIGTNGRGSGPM